MPQRNQSFTSKAGAQRFSIALACILTLSGCSSSTGSFLAPKPELPGRILYVAATGIDGTGAFIMCPVRSFRLPHSQPRAVAQNLLAQAQERQVLGLGFQHDVERTQALRLRAPQ